MPPEPVPFIEYLNAVDALLEARYGITSNDVETEPIAKAQDDNWTPEECVEWLGTKYDLEPINQPSGDKHAGQDHQLRAVRPCRAVPR